jgi:hypothetical protein
VSVVESLSPASASRFTAARDAADSLRGEKRLACAVLASGIREKDIPFVQSEDFRFWALLAGYSPSEAQRRALKVVVPSAPARVFMGDRVRRLAVERPGLSVGRMAMILGCAVSTVRHALRAKGSREDARGATNGR